jgi:hypothetical protein
MLLCRRTDPDRAEAVDAKAGALCLTPAAKRASAPSAFAIRLQVKHKRDNGGQTVKSFHLRVRRDFSVMKISAIVTVAESQVTETTR